MLRSAGLSSEKDDHGKLGLDFGAVVWMRTSSNRELARQIGVSETAVRRAEKAGRIRREADGAWDLVRVKAAWARNTDRAQQRRQHGAMKPVPEAALGAVRESASSMPGGVVRLTRHEALAQRPGVGSPAGPGAAGRCAQNRHKGFWWRRLKCWRRT
jgi:hypothetical protein